MAALGPREQFARQRIGRTWTSVPAAACAVAAARIAPGRTALSGSPTGLQVMHT
jgi:hypothetical protein